MTAGHSLAMMGEIFLEEAVMNSVFKRIGVVLGIVVGLLVIFSVVMIAVGASSLNKSYEINPEPVVIPTTDEALARGEYLFASQCAGCHGKDAAGTSFFNDPRLASIPAPNLTAGSGGAGSTYSDLDFVRAIRHGVEPDGKGIAVMPVSGSWYLTDEDLGSIIAYLRSVPPVDKNTGEKNIKPLGNFLIGIGFFNLLDVEKFDHNQTRPEVVERGVTAEYGEYLVNTGDCRRCHGDDLSGGQPPAPDSPRGPNLTPGGELEEWTAQEFIDAMRTGISPHGHDIDPEFMPWEDIGQLNDDDLTAMLLYLQSLPSLETTTD